MCLANDFAALSAPCVKCVRVRLHIIAFPFDEAVLLILFQSFISDLNLSIRPFDSQLCATSFCSHKLCLFLFLFLSVQRCTAVAFVGFVRLWRRFSLAGRHRAGIPSWVHWQCSSGSLLTAPLITQGHNHRPL